MITNLRSFRLLGSFRIVQNHLKARSQWPGQRNLKRKYRERTKKTQRRGGIAKDSSLGATGARAFCKQTLWVPNTCLAVSSAFCSTSAPQDSTQFLSALYFGAAGFAIQAVSRLMNMIEHDWTCTTRQLVDALGIPNCSDDEIDRIWRHLLDAFLNNLSLWKRSSMQNSCSVWITGWWQVPRTAPG